MENKNKKKLSRLTRYACYVTATDPEILEECPYLDHQLTQFTCQGLVLQFMLLSMLMGYSLTNIIHDISPEMIYGVSLLIALTIYNFEVRLISSDWSLSGVLKQENKKPALAWFGKLLLRIGISCIFSVAFFSIPLELKIQEGPINTQLLKNHNMDNKWIFEKLDARKSEIEEQIEDRKTILTTLLNKDNQLKELSQTQKQIINDLEGKYSKQSIESLRQQWGTHGRAKGKKGLYAEAELLKAQYENSKEQEQAQLAITNSRITNNNDKIKTLSAEITTQETELNKFVMDKDELVKKDMGYLPIKDDYLARYMALQEVYDNPETGKAAKIFGMFLRAALITLELLPLISKLFFSQASLYPVLISNRIKLKAAENIIHSQTKLKEFRAQYHSIPKLKVIRRPEEEDASGDNRDNFGT